MRSLSISRESRPLGMTPYIRNKCNNTLIVTLIIGTLRLDSFLLTLHVKSYNSKLLLKLKLISRKFVPLQLESVARHEISMVSLCLGIQPEATDAMITVQSNVGIEAGLKMLSSSSGG